MQHGTKRKANAKAGIAAPSRPRKEPRPPAPARPNETRKAASTKRRYSGIEIIAFTESINHGISAEFTNDQKGNSVRKLLIAAIESFASKGFHGTTTRDIARAADMSPAALYVHFSSKQELLFKLTLAMATAMLDDLRRAAASEIDPARQLRALVSSYARCNARMHTAVHAATYEFDVLSPDQQRAIVAIRRHVNQVFIDCLLAGRACGQFDFKDEKVVRLSVMSLCVSIAAWFSPAGPLLPEELGDQYGDMIIRMIAPAT
ncbi:MAG: TetR/AcrR family transcriptional regulator [Xanthobacteraceae bacterium]